MKSFSELTSASQVDNADILAISQTSGNGYASKKTTVKDITDKSNLNLAEEYDSTSTYAVDDYVIYESVLYKCIASTTGTFDSTKWTSVVVTDEMGSGGGGTGGHTIIDENGTSMAARAGLQFVGAVEVTDDSANNRTLVEVLGGEYFYPAIYSTTEREIGVWTDGKPLYEKTIDFGALPNNNSKSVNHDISNIDKIVFLNGIAIRTTDGDTIPIPHSHYNTMSNNLQLSANNTSVNVRVGSDASNRNGYVVMRYTKTTDTAGSGTWTPQGVPTHHYSTDEQIIGTWIDGSTLYEKSFDFSSSPITLPSGNTWTSTGISNSGISKIISYDNVMTVDGNNYTSVVAVAKSTGTIANYISLQNQRSSATTIAYLTLQYTKTT